MSQAIFFKSLYFNQLHNTSSIQINLEVSGEDDKQVWGLDVVEFEEDCVDVGVVAVVRPVWGILDSYEAGAFPGRSIAGIQEDLLRGNNAVLCRIQQSQDNRRVSLDNNLMCTRAIHGPSLVRRIFRSIALESHLCCFPIRRATEPRHVIHVELLRPMRLTQLIWRRRILHESAENE